MSEMWKAITVMALKLTVKVIEMILKVDVDGDGKMGA